MRVKTKYELYQDELKRYGEEYQTSFTIACRKGFNRTDLRRFIAKTLGDLGVGKCKVLYATDSLDGGNKSNSPIAWHVAVNKKLSVSQLLKLQEKLDSLRKRLRLGSKRHFFRFNICDTFTYMIEHAYFDMQDIE